METSRGDAPRWPRGYFVGDESRLLLEDSVEAGAAAQVLLLTLARALEAFLGITEKGHASEVFLEEDSDVYVGLDGLDRCAKLCLRKWDAPTDDVDEQVEDVDGEEKPEPPTLARERFVAWSRRLLAPGCRPPAARPPRG